MFYTCSKFGHIILENFRDTHLDSRADARVVVIYKKKHNTVKTVDRVMVLNVYFIFVPSFKKYLKGFQSY